MYRIILKIVLRVVRPFCFCFVVVVVVVVDIGSWVLPLSLNCSLVRQPLDLPSEVLQ